MFFLSWPSGLAVTIWDDRAARRWRRRFKSGCTPIFLYIYIYIYFENRKKKEKDDWRVEKMTTATQPGIEPRTTRFPGDCSSS